MKNKTYKKKDLFKLVDQDWFLIKEQSDVGKVRKMLGITAEKLGDMIGISRQAISNVETGRFKLTATNKVAMNYAIRDYIKENDLVLVTEIVEVKKFIKKEEK